MLLKQGRTDETNGPEMAVGWLKKAADQGHAEAKKALGQ
jgi:TPR repeat protein